MNSAPQPLSEREQTDESLRVERERADRTLEDALAIVSSRLSTTTAERYFARLDSRRLIEMPCPRASRRDRIKERMPRERSRDEMDASHRSKLGFGARRVVRRCPTP